MAIGRSVDSAYSGYVLLDPARISLILRASSQRSVTRGGWIGAIECFGYVGTINLYDKISIARLGIMRVSSKLCTYVNMRPVCLVVMS